MVLQVDFTLLQDIFEILSLFTVVLGIPLAIWQYYDAKKKEQRDREYGTYDALDQKYTDYCKMCLEHPELDVANYPNDFPVELTPVQRKQQNIMLTMLIALFERAYLMFREQTCEIKRRRWTGWVEYFHDYAARDNFREWWKKWMGGYDLEFMKYFQETHLPKEYWIKIPLRL